MWEAFPNLYSSITCPKITFYTDYKKRCFNSHYCSCNSFHTKFHVYTQTRMADKHSPAVTTLGIPCVRCSYPFEMQNSYNISYVRKNWGR